MIANKISGWYYDLQLENRLTCASLHPNRRLNSNKTKWEQIKEKDKDEDFKITVEKNDVSYDKNPICRAILTEDFNVSVANSWSDFGGDMLGQMWESIKPLAPYVGSVKSMIHTAVADYGKEENKEMVARINESKMSKTLADVMIALDKNLNTEGSGINVEDYLNRALVVQGTRFSYYSGSGTSFGNLMMKFTVFPTFKGSTYKTATSQVQELLPYCIGKFVTGTDGLTMNDEKSQKIIDNMIGWQKPPGGFKANVKNVDVIQEGTLLLRFGAYYAIPNLVIENATFNFSKQMTKNPTDSSEKISPLYCDVTIQLRPVTKYSDDTLKEYIFGAKSSKILSKLNEEMKTSLNKPQNEDYVY